jgi:hypothetical protein
LAALDFWIRFGCGVTIPGRNCLNPSRERQRAVSPGPATKAAYTQNISWVVLEVHQNHHPRAPPQLNPTIFAPNKEFQN